VESEKSFRKAISLEADRLAGRRVPRSSHRPQLLQYAGHVRYVEQLRRYRAAFPEEQVLVLIYDEFRGDNLATVQRVLRFLGVDASLPIDLVDVNPTRLLRSQQLDDLVYSLSVGRGRPSRAVKAAVKALTPRAARRQALRLTQRRIVHGDPPPPNAEYMDELRRRFKPEVVALSEYLGRDLAMLWGYDRIE
jgi:hypothetical protein